MILSDFDIDTIAAYYRLLDVSDGYADKETFYETAKEFVTAYEHQKRERELSKLQNQKETERKLPEAGETYRDIFGEKYLVAAVIKTLSDGTPIEEPFVVLMHMKDKFSIDNVFMPKLKDFMNPQFVKTA